MHFGAAYYPEYLPRGLDRLDRDIQLMLDAGFTYVRLGESAWQLWEPTDGEFRFADHLRARHGNVEEVNEAWSTDHWSLGLGDFADLWPADQNSSPGYDLAWRRFQAGPVSELLDWQADLVRQLARPDQFITHCCVGGHAAIRPAVDSRRIARAVDLPGVDISYSTQETLSLPDPGPSGPPSDWSATPSAAAICRSPSAPGTPTSTAGSAPPPPQDRSPTRPASATGSTSTCPPTRP
ncbi:hypothetical protein GXP74_17695 [Streptacidiphilus sp. P02-A3a]|nr:hypothetical protein GXP74_17695 [Streptacidiphilus sp. P02-A3a]